MSVPPWKPLSRGPQSTITDVLRSPSFEYSRVQARLLLDDPSALRRLADMVESIDQTNAPLAAIADHVTAAVRFLRARADVVSGQTRASDEGVPRDADVSSEGPPPAALDAARKRLVVAALHYLVTPDDLVPDFRVGGYIDDVLLLSYVFGSATEELEPFMDG